ncbi:MAG: class I SAM-dependent methyltransferase [Planctomycetales bacterium]|nr:class I SAM-dependent methyltransferase [Planctomycetales bacterium]
MDPAHLQELIDLEDTYWWHVAKRELVTRLVTRHFPAPGRLVEGGIGSCRNLLEFRALGYNVQGFDISERAVSYGRQRGLEGVRVHDLGTPWPLAPSSVTVCVMLDVLEHLADPVQVLKHAAACLEPGGGIVFTVPAYPWLFSSWDKRLGHYRRYTRRMIVEQAADAGLGVRWLNRWNSFTLPPAIALRTLNRLRGREQAAEFPRVSSPVNWLLKTAARCERKWLERLPLPCGLSLVGVLTR